MKVLLVNGSPNEKGCTYTALSEVASSLKKCGIETEIVHIGREFVHGCVGCGGCSKTHRCVHDDGAISCMLDRMFTAIPDRLAYKPAACVVSCRRGGASATFDEINKYFTINKMPVVSSQYWNSVHGSCAEDVLKDEEGLQIMRVLGRNMAWLLKCIEAGRQAGVPMPEQETHLWTNFIR